MLTRKYKRLLTENESEMMLDTLLPDNFHTILVNEDCDGIDEDTGEVIFKFRKNIIPKQIAQQAYYSLKEAAPPTMNRKTASGGTDRNRVKKDGKKTKTCEYTPVNSGIVGYYDRYPRNPYCRTTAFTQKHFDKFAKAYPIIKFVDDKYKEMMPDKYEKQRAMADITSPDFVIQNTAFTTVTVNSNYQTAVHTDRGDFKDGFGNLVVLRAGRYEGGYFVIVPYRIAIDINNFDLLLVDVHLQHGNTPIKKIDANAQRLSLVMYYRERMVYCGTAEQELEFAKQRMEGDELLYINLNPKWND